MTEELSKRPEFTDAVYQALFDEWSDLQRQYGIASVDHLKNYYASNKNNINVFIYILNDDFVGTYSFLNFKNRLYLCDLYIKPNYRGKRIGTFLILDAQNRAQKMGKDKIFVQTLENTLLFYKRNGFKVVKKRTDGSYIMVKNLKKHQNNMNFSFIIASIFVIALVMFIACLTYDLL